MRTPGISMIVLAYENAPCLAALVHDLVVVLASLTEQYEVVIVDDGSGDGTPTVVDALVRQGGVVSHRHPVNQGVGAAFATGVQAARYDRIGYIDGDGQLAAGDLYALAGLLESADAACGIRASRADPFIAESSRRSTTSFSDGSSDWKDRT